MSATHATLVSLLTRDPALAIVLARHQLFTPLRPSRVRARVVRPHLPSSGDSGDRPEPEPTLWLVTGDRLRRPQWALVLHAPPVIDGNAEREFARASARVQATLGCPARALVISREPAVLRPLARWPEAPVILDPDRVPRVRSLECARRRPTLAALSALLHGRDDARVLAAALWALRESKLRDAPRWSDALARCVHPRGGTLRVNGRGS